MTISVDVSQGGQLDFSVGTRRQSVDIQEEKRIKLPPDAVPKGS